MDKGIIISREEATFGKYRREIKRESAEGERERCSWNVFCRFPRNTYGGRYTVYVM